MKVGDEVIMNEYSSYSGMCGIIKKVRNGGDSFIVQLETGLTLIVTKDVIK